MSTIYPPTTSMQQTIFQPPGQKFSTLALPPGAAYREPPRYSTMGPSYVTYPRPMASTFDGGAMQRQSAMIAQQQRSGTFLAVSPYGGGEVVTSTITTGPMDPGPQIQQPPISLIPAPMTEEKLDEYNRQYGWTMDKPPIMTTMTGTAVGVGQTMDGMGRTTITITPTQQAASGTIIGTAPATKITYTPAQTTTVVSPTSMVTPVDPMMMRDFGSGGQCTLWRFIEWPILIAPIVMFTLSLLTLSWASGSDGQSSGTLTQICIPIPAGFLIFGCFSSDNDINLILSGFSNVLSPTFSDMQSGYLCLIIAICMVSVSLLLGVAMSVNCCKKIDWFVGVPRLSFVTIVLNIGAGICGILAYHYGTIAYGSDWNNNGGVALSGFVVLSFNSASATTITLAAACLCFGVAAGQLLLQLLRRKGDKWSLTRLYMNRTIMSVQAEPRTTVQMTESPAYGASGEAVAPPAFSPINTNRFLV